ncbi:hypothetical protein SVIOM342S_05026 [Streptomyces violaceorubidus]
MPWVPPVFSLRVASIHWSLVLIRAGSIPAFSNRSVRWMTTRLAA